jgi:large subunit ribosomal protein L18
MSTKKELRRNRIKLGIRHKISGTSDKPRLAVFRSNKQIYAQLIDDVNGVTLASASSLKLATTTGVEQAKEVGIIIAKAATAKGVVTVKFDRGGYLYHGRVKALAEAAREGGLKF